MFNVFGFYKFKKLTALRKNKIILQNFFNKKNIRGTIIISQEGLNGTISGQPKNLILKVVLLSAKLSLLMKKEMQKILIL